MKKIFIFLLFTLNLSAAPTFNRSYNFSTSGTTNSQNIIGQGLSYIKLTFSTTGGTTSACQIKVEASTDNSSWSDVISNQTCTSDGQVVYTPLGSKASYIRVNLGTFTTASGSPVLTANLIGYVDIGATIDNVKHCNDFVGTNAGIKLASCMAALPSTGGIADATGIIGAQTIAQDIFSGISKPVTLILNPSATYTVSARQNPSSSGITIEGSRAIWQFSPTGPITSTNDRAFAVIGTLGTTYNVSGAITIGATSFTAANSGEAATLSAGDWVLIEERDTPSAEIYFYDQMQVASVSGTTVNVSGKFRTGFPGTHNTVTYTRVSSLSSNVTIRNLTINSTYNSTGVVGMTIGAGARTVLIQNVTINMTLGGAFTTYRTADLKVANCTFRSGGTGASEFATLIDSTITGNVFDSTTTTLGAGFSVDFGAAFNVVSGNVIARAGNAGIQFVYGPHNNVISNNVIGWIVGVGTALGGIGAYDNNISDNVLIGGDGASNNGIKLSDDTTASPNVASARNSIVGNQVSVLNFTYPYGGYPHSTADTYIETTNNSGGTLPGIVLQRLLRLYDPADPFIRLSKTNATAQDWDLDGSSDFAIIDATGATTMLTVVKSTGDVQVNTGKLDIKTGGSTTISTGVGSVRMTTANAATNTVWIPIKYNGTTYYVPGWTTNAP